MTAERTQQAPASPYRPPPVERRPPNIAFAVGLLTFMNLFNYLDRYVLPSVLPQIARELSIPFDRLGFLGSAFIIVYMLASPVFGRLGDRYSRRHLLAVGIALWSLASAATGLAHTYGQLLAARAGVGIGEAAYATIAPALISDYYPAERRGKIMALFFAAIPVGSALGYLAGGLIGHAAGWQAAFFFTGLPGLLLAALALRIDEPERGAFDDKRDAEPPALRDALGTLARSKQYVWAVLGYTAATFGIGGLSFWMPTYLARVRGAQLVQANVMVGLVVVTGGLFGTILGGWLGERARGSIRESYLFVCGWSAVATGLLATVMFLLPSLTLLYVLLFISVLLAFVPNGPVNTLIVNSVPATVRATASAISIFCIHFFGDAGSPFLIGSLSTRFGLRNAVLLVPLSITFAGVLWLIGRKRALRAA